MTKRLGKPGALEPTAVEKMPRGYSLGIDHDLGESYAVSLPFHDEDYVSPLMRMMGYTRSPNRCIHYRKRLLLGSTRWRCADCGTFL
jgi:hypothetical protein